MTDTAAAEGSVKPGANFKPAKIHIQPESIVVTVHDGPTVIVGDVFTSDVVHESPDCRAAALWLSADAAAVLEKLFDYVLASVKIKASSREVIEKDLLPQVKQAARELAGND